LAETETLSRDKLYPEGAETDILKIDPTPIVFFLVNAIQDLRKQVRKLSR
jgi:hypothetical protein